jgi:uridylate kinase
MTALTLAQEHQLTIRVFNLFAPKALLNVAQKDEFGSTIFPTIR